MHLSAILVESSPGKRRIKEEGRGNFRTRESSASSSFLRDHYISD